MTPCVVEDAINEGARGNKGDSSYHIRERDPCEVERIIEPEVSHSDQVNRIPTQI